MSCLPREVAAVMNDLSRELGALHEPPSREFVAIPNHLSRELVGNAVWDQQLGKASFREAGALQRAALSGVPSDLSRELAALQEPPSRELRTISPGSCNYLSRPMSHETCISNFRVSTAGSLHISYLCAPYTL